MRRRPLAGCLVVLGVLATALVLAGCGGGGTKSPPLAEELSYVPANAAFVAVIPTNPDSRQFRDAEALARRFPDAAQALDRFGRMLRSGPVDFQRDVRPVLGNDFLAAAPAANAGGDLRGVVGIGVAPTGASLQHLVDKEKARGLRPAGDDHGAKLYTRRGHAYAVRDRTVLVADRMADVKAALARQGNGTMTPDDFAHAAAGLPQSALVRFEYNVPALLSSPRAAKAKRIPWVAALGPVAVAVTPTGSSLRIDYRLGTDRRKLTAADVPLAPGDQTPTLHTGAPVVLGVRDLRHVATFAEHAIQATDPSTATQIEQGRAFLRTFGVDLDRDVLGQLTGGSSVGTDGRAVVVVADLADAAAMTRTLLKLQPFVPMLFGSSGTSGARVKRTGPSQWTITRRGRFFASYGVAAGKLLVGNLPFSAVRRAAVGSPKPPPGSKGSAVVTLAPTAIARLAARRGAPSEALSFLSRLGPGGGWLTATPQALRGELTINVR